MYSKLDFALFKWVNSRHGGHGSADLLALLSCIRNKTVLRVLAPCYATTFDVIF